MLKLRPYRNAFEFVLRASERSFSNTTETIRGKVLEDSHKQEFKGGVKALFKSPWRSGVIDERAPYSNHAG